MCRGVDQIGTNLISNNYITAVKHDVYVWFFFSCFN